MIAKQYRNMSILHACNVFRTTRSPVTKAGLEKALNLALARIGELEREARRRLDSYLGPAWERTGEALARLHRDRTMIEAALNGVGTETALGMALQNARKAA